MKAPLIAIAAVGLLTLLFRNRAVAAAVGSVSGTGSAGEKSFLNKLGVVPGIRNNNPLNIRRGNSAWQGKIPFSESKSPLFEQFKTWVYGVRAGIKNFKHHYDNGNHTLASLIHIWAPPGDHNDTDAYTGFVSRVSGVSAYSPFIWEKQTVSKIIRAMAEMECGQGDIVTSDDFDAAWKLI